MTSIFVRYTAERKNLSIIGCTCKRLSNGATKTDQKNIGKIEKYTNNIILNKNYDPWATANSIDNDKFIFLLSKSAIKYKIELKLPSRFSNITITSEGKIVMPHDPTSITDPDPHSSSSLVSYPSSTPKPLNHSAEHSATDGSKLYEYSDSDLLDSRHLDLGHVHLLDYIAEKINLKKALKHSFPSYWGDILTIAQFFAIECAPAMYCNFWVNKTDSLIDHNSLTSQNISKLYEIIQDHQINDFYSEWSNQFDHSEYIALDNTSISTYSNRIKLASRGYNRDGDNLDQINVSLLFGQQSRLPLYISTFQGSLNDVTTLINTLNEYEIINFINKNNVIIMDKGFYSDKNIDYLFSKASKLSFLIGLPKTKNIFDDLISKNIDLEVNCQSLLMTSSGVVYGRTHPVNLPGGNKGYAHIFLDRNNKIKEQDLILYNIREMYDKIYNSPETYKNDNIYKKFINCMVDKRYKTGYKISLKVDYINTRIYKSGWVILLSNKIDDLQEAIQYYRKKDLVEKAFNHLKNNEPLRRLAVHSDHNMQSKLFIAFIALTLLSEIDNIMNSNHLYVKYTIKEIFNYLSEIQAYYIKGRRLIKPIPALHKKIYKAFGCPLPE
jgi:transposase